MLDPDSSQTLCCTLVLWIRLFPVFIPAPAKKKQTKYLGAGRGPDPVLGFAVSSMVVGQKPLCLLVYQFKSGCSVEFITGNNNIGKQVEVRFCSANINLIPL